MLVQPPVTSKTSWTEEKRLLDTLKDTECGIQCKKGKYTAAEIWILTKQAMQLGVLFK